VTRMRRPSAPPARPARQRRRLSDAGFTVLELIVVLVMIGVLLGVGIPLFVNYLESGSNATAQASVLTALQAANTYYGEQSDTYSGLCPTPKCGAGPTPIGFANMGSGVTAVDSNKSSTDPSVVSIWTSQSGLEVVIAALANDTHNCWVVIEDRQLGQIALGFKAPFAHLYIREKPEKNKSQATCNAGASVFRSAVPDVTSSSLSNWPSA
jgi:prepilin-type N-terminal cleavage/methylation domain-containing protein